MKDEQEVQRYTGFTCIDIVYFISESICLFLYASVLLLFPQMIHSMVTRELTAFICMKINATSFYSKSYYGSIHNASAYRPCLFLVKCFSINCLVTKGCRILLYACCALSDLLRKSDTNKE